MRKSQAAHTSISTRQKWIRSGLAALCFLTLGCGQSKTPAEQATNTPAPPPAVSTQAPPVVTEPEPEATETPSAMDVYVEQRRAERKARGPIKYPPRPPEQAQPASDGTPAPMTSATPGEQLDDESVIDPNATPGMDEIDDDEDS